MSARPIPAELAADLQAGRLEKACSHCGRWEAASRYCTGCYRPSDPSSWYRNGDQGRREEARQKAASRSGTPPKAGSRPSEPGGWPKGGTSGRLNHISPVDGPGGDCGGTTPGPWARGRSYLPTGASLSAEIGRRSAVHSGAVGAHFRHRRSVAGDQEDPRCLPSIRCRTSRSRPTRRRS